MNVPLSQKALCSPAQAHLQGNIWGHSPGAEKTLWTMCSSANTPPSRRETQIGAAAGGWTWAPKEGPAGVFLTYLGCQRGRTSAEGRKQNRLAAPASSATAAANWAQVLAASYLLISTYFSALEFQFVDITHTRLGEDNLWVLFSDYFRPRHEGQTGRLCLGHPCAPGGRSHLGSAPAR